MKKKWIPIEEEKVIETSRYKYIMGWYSHKRYGDRCFRISKYLKESGFYIGHFVIVPEDQESVSKEIVEILTKG